MSHFLPFALPDIGEEEIKEVVECMRSGWITTGPRTIQFEKDFSEYIGSKFSLAVNSATSGLHLALEAIGVGPGDKVIMSPYTFTATAEVVRYLGGDPVFCDIDEKTYNIDTEELSNVIERLKKSNAPIKAIIPVHIAGQACEMGPILEIAKKHQIKVVEDAAHSLPSTYEGNLIGNIGDVTVFSFYATKTMTTAEGGMVCTNDEQIAKRIKIMRLHGFSQDAWGRYSDRASSWYYEIVAPGFKYNLTDIASSIGIHQLKKIDAFYNKRKMIADRYNKAFSADSRITVPFVKNVRDIHSYHLYIIKVEEEIRDPFIALMRENGIGCSVHFIPLHIQPYWRDIYKLDPKDFPKSLKAFKQSVSLPIYTKMSELDVDRVIDAVFRSLDKF